MSFLVEIIKIKNKVNYFNLQYKFFILIQIYVNLVKARMK